MHLEIASFQITTHSINSHLTLLASDTYIFLSLVMFPCRLTTRWLTTSRLFQTQYIRQRTMATAQKKKEWLCILPDNPNVLELRKKVKGYVFYFVLSHLTKVIICGRR